MSPQIAGHTAGGEGGQTTGGLEGQGVPLQASASQTFPQMRRRRGHLGSGGGDGGGDGGAESNLPPLSAEHIPGSGFTLAVTVFSTAGTDCILRAVQLYLLALGCRFKIASGLKKEEKKNPSVTAPRNRSLNGSGRRRRPAWKARLLFEVCLESLRRKPAALGVGRFAWVSGWSLGYGPSRVSVTYSPPSFPQALPQRRTLVASDSHTCCVQTRTPPETARAECAHVARVKET